MFQLDDIKQLVNQADEHTLTVYVTVDPGVQENQAATPAWRVWLKDALRGIEDGMNGARDATWADVRARVEAYFQEYQPNSKGLALFTGPEFQRVYELPLRIDNEASFGNPSVAPLLRLLDEYEAYLIVMVDHEKARFFTAYLGELGFEDAMTMELDTHDWGRKTGAKPSTGSGTSLGRGSSDDEFEQRVEEQMHRFYREVVAQIDVLERKHPVGRIVLGGDEQSAHMVRELLPEKLAGCVVDVLPIPMRFNAKEIMERVQPRALDYEREQEMALVDQVINLAKSRGRAALGREAVMQALEQQRVELLVVPWPLDDPKLEAELPVRVFASSGSMEMVHGEAAERLRAEGGLAARLYYAI